MALRRAANSDIDEPFNIFWNEYHDIEQTSSLPCCTEDEVCKKEDDKNETEIQWLSDVGFTNIAEKIRDHKRIDQNDEDMRMITSSLTRSQANAVRRRIDFLNDVIQQNQPELKPAQARKHKDVRDVFYKSKSAELPGRTARSRCMTDDTSKRHHQMPRQHVSKSISDGMFKDVPLTIHQKVVVSSKISSSPIVAPKPSYSENVRILDQKKKNEYHEDKSKRSEIRRHSASKSENRQSQQSNDLGKHIPGSQLTIISGEQRDRVLNEKSKPNRPTQRNNIKTQNKVPNKEDHNRRHSVPTTQLDEKNSTKYVTENEYVDGGVMCGEVSDLDNMEIIQSCTFYDGDKSRNILNTGTSSSGMKTHNIKGTNSSKVLTPTQDYKVSLVVTSQQDICLPYSSHPKSNSVLYTTTSVQNNVPRTTPSKTNSSYMIPPAQGSIPCASEKSTPRNIVSPKDKIKKSASCSPSESLDLDIIPGFTKDNKMKKNLTSVSSLEYETDIVPFDSLTKSQSQESRLCSMSPKETRLYPMSPKETRLYPTSPKENRQCSTSPKERLYPTSPKESRLCPKSPKESRLCPNEDSKKNKDLSQSKINSNHLKISDTQNDLLPHSGSEDSKSISSRESIGSMDDLGNQSIENDVGIDPNQININVGKDSPEPQAGESPAPDGDARLDVGPMIPKEQPEVIQTFPNLPKFPPLPNFNLSKDITGMTEVDDLSDMDMEKVRSIALIELTALFDAYHIPMNRKKPLLRPKFKDSGVFGVALTSLSQREVNKKHEKATVPRVFKEILIFIERHGLKEEGVLRVPGATTRIKALREAIDKNDLNSIKWEERNVKDVSACLKQFLRDLPEPLLSYEYQNTFLSVEDLPDRKIQLQALNLLVILLKPIHQKTLKALLDTLKKIIDNEETNKMGLNNVAMIMAPNLLLTNGNKIEVEGQMKAAAMTDIMRMLIKYQSILWTIPSFMVGQIRCIYDSGVKTKDPKAVKKIIQKQGRLIAQRGKPRSSGSSGDELDHVEAIIRVKAPSLNKQSMAIKLTNDTTAADVIAKFQWRRQNSQKEKDGIDSTRLNIQDKSEKVERKGVRYHLYESGGNIGERRLEGSANVTAIIKVNPGAEWVLKGYEK